MSVILLNSIEISSIQTVHKEVCVNGTYDPDDSIYMVFAIGVVSKRCSSVQNDFPKTSTVFGNFLVSRIIGISQSETCLHVQM